MKVALTVCLVCCVGAVWSVTLNKIPAARLKLGDIWTNCGTSADKVTIESVTITPDPPQAGKNVSIKATVKFNEMVTGGSIVIDLKAGIITVIDKTLDLCATAKNANITCPINPGEITFSEAAAVPSSPFHLHITGNVKATDQNGKELVCAKVDFELK